MDAFSNVLTQVRARNPALFHEAALQEPEQDPPVVDVDEIEILTPSDFKQPAEGPRPPNIPDEQIDHEGQVWLNLPNEDDGDFERDSPRAREERRHFPTSSTRVGVETLALYLPFHFYPAGTWGIRFFELPLATFVTRLHSLLRRRGLLNRRGLPYSWPEVLRCMTYAVARHEFTHYLVELEALDLELKQRRSIYLPYDRGVYRATYPTVDCVEETAAEFWAWHNPVIKSPPRLRDTMREVIRRCPAPAYAAGADLEIDTAHAKEDAIAAQLRETVARPADPSPVWGTLPRPYVQPWTRYENVSFTMNRSCGGVLADILGPKQPRKTIRIFHR